MTPPDYRLDNPTLVIVDMQNDFVREGAPLEVPTARDTIDAHLRLIDAFRQSGRPIVYTKYISTPYRSLIWNWSPQCEPDTKCCWKGHDRAYRDLNETRPCADIIDEIYPHPEDLIVEKYGYGAFHGTALNDMLRSHDTGAVVMTGTVTQICVEETARESFHYGFPTIVVEDAVSSYAPDLHAATLKNFAMKFGWVAHTAEIVDRLANG